jgi:hypothetical protein
MKQVILAMPTYRNRVAVATVSGNLSRQITQFTGAAGQTLNLPSPNGRRKEFMVVNTSANTVTVAAPAGRLTAGTTVAGNSIAVTTGTAARFLARAGMWYRV